MSGGGGWVFWCKSCCACLQLFGSFDASWLQISCQGDKYSTHTELIQFSSQGLHPLPVWAGIKWKGNSVKPPQVWEEGEHSKPAVPEVLFLDSSVSSGGQRTSVPNSSKTWAKNSCLQPKTSFWVRKKITSTFLASPEVEDCKGEKIYHRISRVGRDLSGSWWGHTGIHQFIKNLTFQLGCHQILLDVVLLQF